MAKDGWRLCSLQTVEQLKCLVSVLPVWVSGIVFFIIIEQRNTFGVLQALQTNNLVGSHFKIPPAWVTLVPMLALAAWIFIYESIYIPLAKKITKKDKRLTMKQRFSIGLLLATLSMLVSGCAETKRRDSALGHGTFASPHSIAMLVPQFVVSGLAEAFSAVAMLEFLTMQMPETMRTVAGAVFFLGLAIAAYVSSLLLTIINKVTAKTEKMPWIVGRDLNKNKLDLYYYVMSGLGAINFFYFFFFASKYVVNNRLDASRDASKDEEKAVGS